MRSERKPGLVDLLVLLVFLVVFLGTVGLSFLLARRLEGHLGGVSWLPILLGVLVGAIAAMYLAQLVRVLGGGGREYRRALALERASGTPGLERSVAVLSLVVGFLLLLFGLLLTHLVLAVFGGGFVFLSALYFFFKWVRGRINRHFDLE